MLLNAFLILTVLALALVCLVLALRCCGVERLTAGGRVLALDRRPPDLQGQRFTPAMGFTAVVWAAGLLAAYYAVSYLFCVVSEGGGGWDAFQRAWTQWDANNYLRIAQFGYRGFSLDGMHTTLAFYPLYPWLMRLVHVFVPSWFLCGLIVSCFCFMVGCYFLARLTTERFGWPAARTALTLLSAYPFSFFFASVFAESLFFALSAAAFYFICRHKWLVAGLVGALAALTRMQGALLLCAGLVEYAVAEDPVQKLRDRRWRALGQDAVHVLLPLMATLLGTGVYLAVNWAVDGDPFRFIYYEREVWSQGFAPLPDCLRTIWTYLTNHWGEPIAVTTWGPELAVFLLCLGGLLYAARHMPPVWTAYFLACVLLNFSLSWPLSCARYMACAFPLFVTLAVSLRRHQTAAALLALVWAMVQGLMLCVHLAGGHIV